ncbi:DUF6973 domain-containing protein [Paenibacillus sp. S-38]|uniref:DUF6973 domain-containing protein n=1 Tax=Paenibacillus sp. S-38 TaxID=3416710 RepID=UPI003CFAF16D
MFKKLALASLVSVSLVSSGTAAFAAQEEHSVEAGKKQEKLTIDQILKDPKYKDLPKDHPLIPFYKEIELYKKQNPSLTTEQVLQHFTQGANSQRSISPAVSYSEFEALTATEKYWVVMNPPFAALTLMTRQKAFKYTDNNYGRHDSLGDEGDAFRHAIWNALMCKYITKAWAELYATAHEDKPTSFLEQINSDGYSNYEHRRMDLHNNQKGRDCWLWSDSITTITDSVLQNRVIAKIDAGQMVILH